MPLNRDKAPVGNGVFPHDVVFSNTQSPPFRCLKEPVARKGAVIPRLSYDVRTLRGRHRNLLWKSSTRSIFQTAFQGFLHAYITEHVSCAEKVCSHGVQSCENHSLRLLLAQSDTLMIKVDVFNPIDHMNHES